MTDVPETEQTRLRDLYLEHGGSQDMPAEDPLPSVVKRSNVQTGTRDLLVLAISSLFALLLIFFAPLARLSHSALGKTPKIKSRPENRFDR